MTVKLIGNPNIGIDGREYNAAFWSQWTCEASGTLTEILTYSLFGGYAKAAIYADNGSNYPGTRLAKQDTTTPVIANQWNPITLEASCEVTEGVKYFLCIIFSTYWGCSSSASSGGIGRVLDSPYGSWTWADPAPGGLGSWGYVMALQGWGTIAGLTISPPGLAQVLGYGTPKLTQIIKPAGTSQAIAYGAPLVQILEAPVLPTLTRKVLITHPAIISVTVIKDGATAACYDNLSNLNELRIEDAVELPVIPPASLLVKTLSGEIWTFDIPA